VSTVELLEQDDAGELVREGQRAEREAVVDAVEVEAQRPADDEAQVATALATILQEAGEGHAVKGLPLARKQRQEGPVGQPPEDLLVFADLYEVELRVAGQELLIVLHVVGEGRAEAAHGEDGDPHAAILTCPTRTSTPEREGGP